MITKMTVLQTTAFTTVGGDNSIVNWSSGEADTYKKAGDLFEYLVANPTANVKEAFVTFFGKEPDMVAKTKKSRNWSVGKVYVHESDDNFELGGALNSFQQLAQIYY